MKERIQKVLARAGVASRRSIEEMVLQGRIAVNGKVVSRLPVLIDAETDRVAVDDQPVRIQAPKGQGMLYILMNKPRGVYSTNVAQGEQVRAIDLLPPDVPGRVYPVGRLDAESTGLLLLTNDGDLANRLTHPRYGVVKAYRAVTDGYITDRTLAELRKGIWLSDPKGDKGIKTGPCNAKVASRDGQRTVLEITLQEGRNPQVRRTLAKLGHKVRQLARVRFGSLTLHGLAPGKWRPLTQGEVRRLKRSFQHEGTKGTKKKEGAMRGEAPTGRGE